MTPQAQVSAFAGIFGSADSYKLIDLQIAWLGPKFGDMLTDEPRNAGAPEVEVTPEMIEAGVQVFLKTHLRAGIAQVAQNFGK